PNFPENGGGIYRVGIGCDGTLSDEGLVTAAKLARQMVALGTDAFVLAASEILGSPAGSDVHLLGLAPPVRQASSDTFGDDDAIVASLAVTADGRFGLIGDNSGFSSV